MHLLIVQDESAPAFQMILFYYYRFNRETSLQLHY